MSRADECRCDEACLLLDRDTLAAQVELILTGGPRAAGALARLLDELREAVEGGPQDIGRAHHTLVAAIGLAYLHSQEHAAALALYRLSLEGHLQVEDEPARLIGAALSRSRAPKKAVGRRARK